jgi:peptide/nickel transport system permease protein
MTIDAQIAHAAGAPIASAGKRHGYILTVIERLRYDYLTMVFVAIIGLIVLAAILAPLVAPYDPNETSMLIRLKPIGFQGHLLGTDDLGRDMLSRLIHGGRVSLLMGILPVILAVMIGGLLGVVAGFVGGWTNTVIMRTMDVFYAFPSVLLAVAISGTMGGGMISGLIALTFVFIPSLSRIAETATAQVRSLDFVEAARASGASSL